MTCLDLALDEPLGKASASSTPQVRLTSMEEDEPVHREVHRAAPPKVEYSLTEHGVPLNTALASPGRWGTGRMQRIGAGGRVPGAVRPWPGHGLTR
ncbi:winged helix-turn-helix transcriptional regulator [Streptomyces sp. NPDC097981]|uniref:winged helix-turn-helix transcriptional regulator n=1 Tax=Streptomyces sp. NPDC097981 TaxID=3155428 RepID=UPI00332AE3B1